MQRNEGPLLQAWLCYHGLLVGFENIYVIDNGSDDVETKQILGFFEQRKVNIDYNFDRVDDFDFKGRLVTNQFLKISRSENPSCLYFPLDCDEFLSVLDANDRPTTDKSKIYEYLDSIKKEHGAYKVGNVFDSNPVFEDYFLPNPMQKKVFISGSRMHSLDNGFHTVDDDKLDHLMSRVSYIHFHYRVYEDYVRLAKQKLAKDLTDFSRTSLQHYQGESVHCARGLLATEADYYSGFSKENRLLLPGVLASIRHAEAEVMGDASPAMPSIDSVFVSSDKVEAAMAHPTGFVDLVEVWQTFLRVAGWAVLPSGSAAKEIEIRINNESVSIYQTNTVRRADVARAHGSADEFCGFDCLVKIANIPEDGHRIDVFANDQTGKGLGELILREPHAINWTEIRTCRSASGWANRNRR